MSPNPNLKNSVVDISVNYQKDTKNFRALSVFGNSICLFPVPFVIKFWQRNLLL